MNRVELKDRAHPVATRESRNRGAHTFTRSDPYNAALRWPDRTQWKEEHKNVLDRVRNVTARVRQEVLAWRWRGRQRPAWRSRGTRTILGPVEFQAFDQDYVRRLVEGDRFVGDHFTAYFEELLYIKLRARARTPEAIEEIRQETFARVLEALRQKGGLQHPERLGAFVSSVCNHVLLEGFRNGARHRPIGQGAEEPPDNRIDLEAPLLNQHRQRLVERVLAELSKRDQKVLRMIFLEEVDAAEACGRLGVGEGYLRVLLHRAKSRFRDKLAEKGGPDA
jgi:RNA polymerase sigma-70 factor (ECF subfamily)